RPLRGQAARGLLPDFGRGLASAEGRELRREEGFEGGIPDEVSPDALHELLESGTALLPGTEQRLAQGTVGAEVGDVILDRLRVAGALVVADHEVRHVVGKRDREAWEAIRIAGLGRPGRAEVDPWVVARRLRDREQHPQDREQ